MRKLLYAGAFAAVLFAQVALAVKPGGTVFVKTRDAKLLKEPDAKAKVLTSMRPGMEVTWNGAAPSNRQFHNVETSEGKNGFTLQQNLTPNKPAMEYLSRDDGKPIDAQAFASSGAATKALSEAALKYSANKPNTEELARGLISAESVAASVSAKEVNAFQAKVAGDKK